MSYILDALKKSEKERQRGTVPDVLTVQDVMKGERKKRQVWPYVVLAVLLLNAVVLAWWFGHWQSEKPKMVAQTTAVQGELGLVGSGQPSEVRSIALPSSEKSKTVRPDGRESARDRAHKPEVITAKRAEDAVNFVRQNLTAQSKINSGVNVPDKPAPADEKGLREEVSSPPQQSATSKQISNVHSMSITAFAPDGRKVDLKDLPSSIQQSLPAFAISVSVYSDDPASRMVKVDGQMLQEGQYLAEGIKLEEIATDGVVFSYQNYRFRVGFR